MSGKKIAILGKPFPGVTCKACVITSLSLLNPHCRTSFRPYIPVGATASTFPMAIKCSTEEDATQIMKLAELIQDVHDGMTATEIASIFYHGFDDDDINVPGPFYAVCIASRPGIYTNWHVFDSLHDESLLTRSLNRRDVSSTLAGWSSPKWSKQGSLKATILFMIMKGRAFEPTGISFEEAFSGVRVRNGEINVILVK